MARVWIQICNANPIAKRWDLIRALEDDDEHYHVARFACLDRCTLCSRQPYAMINGEQVPAATCEELANLIRAAPPLDRSPSRPIVAPDSEPGCGGPE